MKNLIFVIATLLFSIMELSASNAPRTSLLRVFANEKAVVLDLSNENQKSAFITITDSKDFTVFSESLDGYNRKVKYDLRQLPVGTYTIKVAGENFVELHETTITHTTVHIENTESHYKPILKETGGKIMVDAQLYNQEDINVAIYDNSGELVYDYSDLNGGDFRKTFNLELLEKGNYNVVVSTDYFNEVAKISL